MRVRAVSITLFDVVGITIHSSLHFEWTSAIQEFGVRTKIGNHPTWSTQDCITGVAKSGTGFAGIKVGMSSLPGGSNSM